MGPLSNRRLFPSGAVSSSVRMNWLSQAVARRLPASEALVTTPVSTSTYQRKRRSGATSSVPDAPLRQPRAIASRSYRTDGEKRSPCAPGPPSSSCIFPVTPNRRRNRAGVIPCCPVPPFLARHCTADYPGDAAANLLITVVLVWHFKPSSQAYSVFLNRF